MYLSINLSFSDDLDFDIHEPRFQMPHGDFGRHDDLDWRQILDLYSGDHPPTVPPPRPMLSTPRPDQYLPPPPPRPEALQGTSSSDNTVTFENDGKKLVRYNMFSIFAF